MNRDEGFLSTTGGKITVGAGIAGIFAIIILYMGILNAKREVVSLGNATKTEIRNISITVDKMWKTLQQKAGITKQYTPEDQRKMVKEVAEGQKGGLFAKVVAENNPRNYDDTMLRNLMVSVDTERTAILRTQQKADDYNRERNNWLEDPWYGQFLTAYKPIEFEHITSTRTKNAEKTGVDDDVDLFPSKK